MSVQQIIEYFDWTAYLDEHFEYKLTTNGEYRICCPNCGELKYKCYVNPDKGFFNCFKCSFHTGKEFDIVDFVATSEGLSRESAYVRLLTECIPTTPDELDPSMFEDSPEESVKKGLREIQIPQGVFPLSNPKDPMEAAYWNYLLGRGLTASEIQKAGTHYAPLPSSEIYGRVLWLVYGGNKQLVSWVSRAVLPGAKGEKYLNCPDSDIKQTFWPFVKPKGHKVILVEGIMDCLAVRRLFPSVSSYATLSKSLTEGQMDLLSKWDVSSVLLFWDKKDAKKEILKTVEDLKIRFPEVKVPAFSHIEGDADAGDSLNNPTIAEQIKAAVEDAVVVDSFEYMAWQLTD